MPEQMDPMKLDLESHLYGETFGIPEPSPRDVMVKVGKAILCVAGADGRVSPAEMKWFLGMAKAFGAKDDVIAEWLRFDYRNARLNDYLDASTRPLARVILYSAIRVARADGVDEKERHFAVEAAKRLGVETTIVPAIEGLLSIEEAVKTMRIRLLAPESGGPQVQRTMPNLAGGPVMSGIPPGMVAGAPKPGTMPGTRTQP